MSKKIPIVISSCDAYADIWPVFFHFFFHYWPEAKDNIYLLSNHKRCEDKRVHTILSGDDRDWGENMLVALPQIPGDTFLYFQDDYLLNEPVDTQTLANWVESFQKLKGRFLSLRHYRPAGDPIADTPFREVPKDSKDTWAVDLQAAVWDKATLQSIAEKKLDVWQSESEIRKLRHSDIVGFYNIDEGTPRVISYIEGVKGKFWMPAAVDYCRKNGVTLDLKTRPCPPQGQSFFPKLIRSYYKRKMKLQLKMNQRLT